MYTFSVVNKITATLKKEILDPIIHNPKKKNVLFFIGFRVIGHRVRSEEINKLFRRSSSEEIKPHIQLQIHVDSLGRIFLDGRQHPSCVIGNFIRPLISRFILALFSFFPVILKKENEI